MKDTYSIKLIKTHNPLVGWLLNKTLRKVKGNVFPQDMNAPPNAKYMLVIFENERRAIINLDKYNGYYISKELFYINAQKAKEDSQGKADLT